MKDQRKRIGGWSTALLVVTVASLVPVVWIVLLSLKDPSTIGDGSFIPHKWTTSNFTTLLDSPTYRTIVLRTVGIAAAGNFRFLPSSRSPPARGLVLIG